MEVRLSHRLQSCVPPFTPYKACLLLVMVGVFIGLLARNATLMLYFLKQLLQKSFLKMCDRVFCDKRDSAHRIDNCMHNQLFRDFKQ